MTSCISFCGLSQVSIVSTIGPDKYQPSHRKISPFSTNFFITNILHLRYKYLNLRFFDHNQFRTTSFMHCSSSTAGTIGSSNPELGWLPRPRCCVRVVSRRGGVSLDIPSPETSLSMGDRDLETQFGCSLGEELDLLSAVSLLVVLSAFINVSLTVL